MATFADMHLKPGQAIQLQLKRTDQVRLYTLLVGYLTERAIIVTTPALSQIKDAYEVLEGDRFVCRAFSGRRAFAFTADVLRVAQIPFPHLYLSYPQQVEAVVIRKATRVPFQREISVLKACAEGGEPASHPVTLCDLSLTGAGLEAAPDLATTAEPLELVIPRNGSEQEALKVKGVVRTGRLMEDVKEAPPRSHYGLEFVDLSEEHTRGLQEVIQQQLLDEI